MAEPPKFNDRPPADDPRVKFFSSESSCRSMKSEPSLNKPKGIQTRKSDEVQTRFRSNLLKKFESLSEGT
ncbi:hypothetical protein DNTS_029790, partial [Danionella cerebrum]